MRMWTDFISKNTIDVDLYRLYDTETLSTIKKRHRVIQRIGLILIESIENDQPSHRLDRMLRK